MAFFDFINSFVEDNEKEIKAAADGAAAVWSIGSKLAGIAADMAVDTAKEAYSSLVEEEPTAEPAKKAPKASESTDANNDIKALTKELKELMRQNEALQKRLQELEEAEAEREAMEEQSCLDAEIAGEDYYNSLSDEEDLPGGEVYENTTQREVVVKLAGFGEAYTVQAMHYLLNKYPSGANLPWVKVDQEERCVTVLRPEGGFAYIGDESVEEIL